MSEETREPGTVRYHYNREERRASLPDHLRDTSKKKGILRGNRSLLITLIDVVFLVMLVIVISVFYRVRGDGNILQGYAVSAGAITFGDNVLVSVKVKAREDRVEAQPVRIRIGYPAGGTRIELSGFLPEAGGVEEIYRGSLPLSPEQTQIRIDLFADETTGSMTVRIREE